MDRDTALRSLRIGDLELFITAARLGNLGQAAALHHLSQSAASAAIMRVEKSLGRNLCTHEKRQFGLTKEGKGLLPRAEEWVKQLRQSVALEDLPLTKDILSRIPLAST
jgi:DNA-binding transcriptional LysR family regulator